MATIATKWKLNTKSIKDKYNALKEAEDGNTKLKVGLKRGLLKETFSIWLKNKEKIFDLWRKSNSKRQLLREGSFANLDQAIFKWLLIVIAEMFLTLFWFSKLKPWNSLRK